MKIDISNVSMEPKWFTMDDGAEFKIRPYPSSKESFAVSSDGNMVLTGGSQFKKFMYCLVDFRKVDDAKGAAIKCSDEVKELIYEHRLGAIPNFVFIKLAEFKNALEEDVKN